MKTTFKKSVLAFLTCVLALAFALTGCSGGGKDPKANFVGSWELSGGTLEGEELTDEYMKMLEDWGVHCVLILDEDGTGVLDMFLEVADLKWEAKDATTVTITAEDESHDLKLKDDKLVLEVDGDKLIFTKSDKDLSGTVKKDREAAEKEEEIDEAVEDDDVQSVEISPAVTVADDDLCTITITEKFKDDWGDIGFVVNITNKSDKDLTFYAPSGKTNVNGTMKEPWFSAHLMPGTNATEEFTFSNGELDSLDDLVNTTIGIDAYLTAQAESFKTFAHDVALQVAAVAPICATRDQVPAETVEHEKQIYMAQAAESGKPEAIQEKMAVGRLEKFYKQSVLTEQEFIKDSSLTIKKYAEQVSKELGDTITVVAFDRLVRGE